MGCGQPNQRVISKADKLRMDLDQIDETIEAHRLNHAQATAKHVRTIIMLQEAKRMKLKTLEEIE